MGPNRTVRFIVIALVLLAGAAWSLASARDATPPHPGSRFLATGAWLQPHLDDAGLVVVDVRDDKDFDGRAIPGALRMPWSSFRYDDPARGIGDRFVGEVRAQEILGNHGIARNDTVVLYDSVKKDGGATSSYVFWVLDLLGHEKVKVLERGIDGWVAAGGAVVEQTRAPDPVLYQAPVDEMRLQRGVDAGFILSRLGDPHYQIVDVRSREEYLGEKPNPGLGGETLKLGHMPTAANVDYRANWADPESKAIKSQAELLGLYRGLDSGKTVITYCHSGRRASFGYFMLRLMGLENVALYEDSWYGWGNPRLFYPVEVQERPFAGALPASPLLKAAAGGPAAAPVQKAQAKGGYVSCGG
ncbi:MAG: rhodanese-like domain-containing protein [Deferrisomatales bacterium]|nr:rhodanese-like domain-containing protein [Deferrisomatales bacterium]